MKFKSKIIPAIFLILGLILLAQVALPLIGYKFWENAVEQNSKNLVSPETSSVLTGISIEKTVDNFPLIVSNRKRDQANLYQYFTITIPSINIVDQLVYVDSNDLSKGLILLPGGALPGEKGNVFISGHSELPKFIPGKKAAFETLPKIGLGDEITTYVLGTKYVYKVIDIKIVKPNDVSVISPPDNTGRYISLMTCVPPGLNTKRLVVVGKLI